jgi:hypothetical protein
MIQAKVNNFMRPFYLRLIEDVLFENKFCLGLYTVSDFMKMSQTCKNSYNIIVKNKIIKRLVRYGNLDEPLRIPFWRKLSPFYHMQESLKD